jgi:2-dehydropantoate 2-reductase
VADQPRVAVLGAGSIGGFVGGCWMAAGLPVTLIGRPSFAQAIAEHGLTVSDEQEWSKHFPAAAVDYRTDPAALQGADIIALAVKSGATAGTAREIALHAKPGATVLSLQNGISNYDVLSDALGDRFKVVRGMVPFNVAYLGDGHFHKGVAGQLCAENTLEMAALSDAVGTSPAGLTLSDNMTGIAWGKLLINLNNAVNALSGRPLKAQLVERDYRRVMAATLREGLAILDAAGIAPAKVGSVGPRLMPHVMNAPNWLFMRVFMPKWKIDDRARSSMADDLAHGRKTEIGFLNGEILTLAERIGRDAPVNRRVVDLIRKAEAGAQPLGPAELRRAVLGR